ncbi:hypothetical protein [Streptomyces sp. NPDC058268]|uniref:hypothetical protein n=1 Tax=Streptomyces sp. NPDC058268 TaxID=3346413 RepID=UPI0036E88DB8
MVIHQPAPLWCCPMGLVMGAAYERARDRFDAANHEGEQDQGTRAAYAAMLVALVNWCEHQIDVHGTDPGPVERCPVCEHYQQPASAEQGWRGPDGTPMDAEEWAYERRVHQVAHRLGPRIVTLVGEAASVPSRTSVPARHPDGGIQHRRSGRPRPGRDEEGDDGPAAGTTAAQT